MMDIRDELAIAAEEYGSLLGITKRDLKHAFVGEIEYPAGVNALLATRDALLETGTILEEDLDSCYYVAEVEAGAANANTALVVAIVGGRRCALGSCAKEGLIKQSTAKKAVEKVKEAALKSAGEHSAKDFLLTKEELEEKLLALDASREGFEPIGLFAMCYSPAFGMEVDAKLTCNGCGKTFELLDVTSYGDESALDYYNVVAEEYQVLGYDAQIQYFCDECVIERSMPRLRAEPTNVFFAFRAKGSDTYHLMPLESRYCYDDELKMVLEFLKGAESYQELDKDYSSSSLFETAEGFKECIERVLGLEI